MATQNVSRAILKVKPILSVDHEESRKRVLNLYKAWYRQLPYIVRLYDIPKSVDECRKMLRQEFSKHEHLNDIRVIDMLIVKEEKTAFLNEEMEHIIEMFPSQDAIVRVVNVTVNDETRHTARKGQMSLKEVVEYWQQKGHIMSYFKETVEPKPTDFLSKFLQGLN